MAPSRNNVVLVLKKVFHADAEFLFDAWTDPALMVKWFHSQADWTTRVIRCDLRVGGAWEIVMDGCDGKSCPAFGVYREIDRPRRLVFTWHPYGDKEYETVVTLQFNSIDEDSTELILTHVGLRDEKDRADHAGGWEGCLSVLQSFVQSRGG